MSAPPKLGKRRSRFATRQIPRRRSQSRERPAAKRSNLLAGTNARRGARRPSGRLSPDAVPGASVNRAVARMRAQHRLGVASGAQMSTFQARILLLAGQIATRIVHQAYGENATPTII